MNAKEFKKMMEDEREYHEAMQSPFANIWHPIAKNSIALNPKLSFGEQKHFGTIDITIPKAEYNAMVKAKESKQKVQETFDAIGRERYIQYNYMSHIMTSIVGYLVYRIQELIAEVGPRDRDDERILDRMFEAYETMYGRTSVHGDRFVNAVMLMRRRMMEDGGFTRHVEMLQRQYLMAINSAHYKYSHALDNDLLAWVYTARALALESLRYDSWIVDLYNKRSETNKFDQIKFRNHDVYPGYEALGRFLKHDGFKMDIDTKGISQARKVVQNQMRLAKIQEYFDLEVKTSQMKGKIQIA